MKNKRFQIICWCLALVPLVLTAIAMPTLPDAVPMHWNAAGEIDRWGSRSSAWMMPLMCIGVNLLFVVLPKIDPKRNNYASFRKSYDIFRMVFNLFLIVMTGITITSAFSPETVRTEILVPAAMGVLFCLLGNYMPKFKHNYFVGIKTPWTLASEEVWRKTHRLGGALWFWGGLVLIAAAFLLPPSINAIVTGGILIVIVAVPVLYSYLAYRRQKPQ